MIAPGHKVQIYLEYHSVCPLVLTGTPPTPVPLAGVSPQKNQRGGHTRLRVRGWKGPNLEDWRKSLALYLLCAPGGSERFPVAVIM